MCINELSASLQHLSAPSPKHTLRASTILVDFQQDACRFVKQTTLAFSTLDLGLA